MKDWKEIERLYHLALQKNPGEREAFFQKLGQRNQELVDKVKTLLANREEGDLLFRTPAFDQALGRPDETEEKAATGPDAYTTRPFTSRPVDLHSPRPGEIFRQFRIEEKLGQGGMGEVFLAHDTALDRQVALKFLPESLQQDKIAHKRFVREAKSAAALNHPFICSIHEVAQTDEGQDFICMEYVEGQTLKEKLAQGPTSIKEVLQIGVEIAEALEIAHREGIVHRDLKPANIMLTEQGHAKVMDFGLAKRVITEEGTEQDITWALTREGSRLGTPAYMSPEQVNADPVDHRSDIFSFGIVLFEMLSGVHPFRKARPAETTAAILQKEPTPVAGYVEGVPELLHHTVTKMLAKDVDHRYQNIHEVLTDLTELGRDTEKRRVSLDLRAQPRWALVAALSAVLLTLAAAYWIYQLARPNQGEAPVQRILTQYTFDEGLQMEPSWSPDGSLLAYASNRSGNFDIWVQSEEGNPIQITKNSNHDWQPDWSPNGKHIVFRSERGGGGLFVIPASGGIARRVASFGYEPAWARVGERILFYSVLRRGLTVPPKLFIVELDVELDGDTPVEFASDFTSDIDYSLSAAWHPDGERVSLMGRYHGEWGFWTYPVHGGELTRSEIAPSVEKRIEEAQLFLGDFSWSPRGDALFFEGTSRSVQDVWRVTVEAKSLRWTNGPERLTASPDSETNFSVCADGTKLAYGARNERFRISIFPFDAGAGKVIGEERTISTGGMVPDTLNLSRDGKNLAFVTFRTTGEDKRLWTRSLETEDARVLSAGDYRFPCWSRDGLRLACRKAANVGTEPPLLHSFQVVLVPLGGGEEQILNSPVLAAANNPYDWSNDGQWILMGCRRGKHSSDEDSLNIGEGRPPAHICLQPVAAAPRAEEQARIIASHQDYNLWQHQFSPDDGWILFNAVERRGARTSRLFVLPTTGGEWIPITDGKYWADKAVWAPDGTIIYYVSNRGGFFNVWGRRFDPANGKTLGAPFQVTVLDSPGLRVDPHMTRMEIGVSDNQLALQLMEVTGNIWVLEKMR